MLKEFGIDAATLWRNSLPWGGGHTAQTDPTRRGWVMIVMTQDRAVFGRRGVKGSFSATARLGGVVIEFYRDLDVAEARDALRLRNAEPSAIGFLPSRLRCGWALEGVEFIESGRWDE